MKNRFITALVSVGLALTMSVTVVAAPLDELQNSQTDLTNKQSENSKQLSSVSKQISDLESSIESYDNQISNMTVKLNDTKSKISNTQAKIQKAEKDLQKAQDDYNAQQKLLDQRIKVIYVNGTESYLSFLLDSKGIGDFISRIETVKQVSELDKQVMADLEEQQKQIKEQKQTLDTQKTQLVKLQSDQQSTLNSLNSKKSQEATVAAQYNAKKATLLKNDKDYKAQLAKVRADIKAAEAQISNAGSSSGGSSVVYTGSATGIEIVKYAQRFLGVPYLWGGNGPDVFDCSGFTKYVYAHFGVNLPRTSEDQCNVGMKVSLSQLQAGDLVFFEHYDPSLGRNDVHHVGIYVANGIYINAPHKYDVVKYSPLAGTDFVYGRRIIK